MAGISKPLYNTIKSNIVTILEAVSTADVSAGNPGFTVERDRYKNWEDVESMTAFVNVIMASMTPRSGGSQIHTDYNCTFNIDMYVLGGEAEEETEDDVTVLTPANIEAADRLDLLIAQVQWGLTQLAKHDFGMTPGLISRQTKGLPLTISNQGENQTVGVFAPARFTLEVVVPYEAADNGPVFNLTDVTSELEIALEAVSSAYTYTHTV